MGSLTSPPVRLTPSFGSYLSLRIAIAVVTLCAVNLSAQAHLLNMSRVTVSLNEDRSLSIVMELDLNDALGSAERYLAVSRLVDPGSEGDLAALMRGLELATRVTIAGQMVPVSVTSGRCC